MAFWGQKIRLILSNAGYSLTELAISTTVIAILATGALQMIKSRENNQNYIKTQENIIKIQQALNSFIHKNNYIPCPSIPNLKEDNINFGKSENMDISGDVTVNKIYNEDTKTCSNNGIINSVGSIPVRTLNIADKLTYDGWGRKFSFRIADKAGSSKDFLFPSFRSDLNIVDIEGTNISGNSFTDDQGAAYVIISYGANGKNLAYGKNFAPTIDNNSLASLGIEGKNANHQNKTYIQNKQTSNFDDIVAFAFKNDIIKQQKGESPLIISKDICNYSYNLAYEKETDLDNFAAQNGSYQDYKKQILRSAALVDNLCKNKKNDSVFPIDISGLELWLDAKDGETIFTNSNCINGIAPSDNSDIGCWQDKSGNGHNAIEANNKPKFLVSSLNNYPAIYFDGNGKTLSILSGLNIKQDSPRTIILVNKPETIQNNYSNIFGTGENAFIDLGSNLNNNRVGLNYSETINGDGALISEANSLIYGKAHILEISGKKDLTTIFNNGKIINDISNSYISWDMRADLGIGHANVSAREYLGSIGEIIVYNKILSDNERNLIKNYLSNKWDINLTKKSSIDDCAHGMVYRKTPKDNVGSCQCPDGEELVTTLTTTNPCHINIKNFGACLRIEKNTNIDFSPPKSGLKLWLDANNCNSVKLDQNKIEILYDLSGNEKNFTNTLETQRPEYLGNQINNMAAIDFDGNKKLSSGSSEILNTKNYSIFLVAKPEENNNYILGTNSQTLNLGNFSLTTNNNKLRYNLYGQTSSYAIDSASDILNDYGIFLIENKNAQISLYVNGLLEDSEILEQNSIATSHDLYLGGSTSSGLANFNGKIAQVFVYDRTLKIDEISQIQSYLSKKWNIINKYPYAGMEGHNLVLWLDASELKTLSLANNKVSSWQDKSSKTNNVTQTNDDFRPKYVDSDKYPYLQFDGVNDVLPIDDDTSLDISKNMTIFIVTSNNCTTCSSGQIIGKGSNQSAYGVTYNANKFKFLKEGDNNSSSESKSYTPDTNITLISAIKENNIAKLYINSTLLGIDENFADFSTNNASLNIGNGMAGSYNGRIYEILVFASSLNDDERKKVEFEIMQKYNINKLDLPTPTAP